jgi:hypothetical protein
MLILRGYMIENFASTYWNFNRIIAFLCAIYVVVRMTVISTSPRSSSLLAIEGIGEKLSGRITEFLKAKDDSLKHIIFLCAWGVISFCILFFDLSTDTESALTRFLSTTVIIQWLMMALELGRLLYFLAPISWSFGGA